MTKHFADKIISALRPTEPPSPEADSVIASLPIADKLVMAKSIIESNPSTNVSGLQKAYDEVIVARDEAVMASPEVQGPDVCPPGVL